MKPPESIGLTDQLVPALDFIASIRIGGTIILLVLLLFGFLHGRRILRGKSSRRRRGRRR